MPVAEEQMRVTDDSELFCDFGEVGGGMLLLYVGEPVDRERYEEVIHLLVSLHVENIYHGDPCLANVVDFEGNLYWIDFLEGNIWQQDSLCWQCRKRWTNSCVQLWRL
jgi:tRNA A-37 threonylcarbamoyl transferase component Bud32